MTTRLLPPDEWPKLAGTEADAIWRDLDPALSHVIVVELDGDIVGTWILMSVLHAECLWIAPQYRKRASVGRRLWTTMQRTARSLGAPVVATAALSDDVRQMLDRIGAIHVPGDHYAMRVI